MQHPETLQKAREELDAVVGTDRLPTMADRTSLPFIEAVYMEALRWTVPVPLSEFPICVTHLTTEGQSCPSSRSPAQIDGGRCVQGNAHPQRLHDIR